MVTVSFDASGGSPVEDIEVTKGSLLTVPTSLREGYTIDGWYTSADLGETYDQKWVFESMKVEGNMTLYAKWEINEYLIQFDGQGGTLIAGQATFTIDHGININPPLFEKDGYDFVGWYTNALFTGNPTTFPLPATQAMTFYALWSEEVNVRDGSSFARAIPINVAGNLTTTVYPDVDIYHMFTPSQSGYYTISSTGTLDPYVELFDQDQISIIWDDDGGESFNFQFTEYLNAGQTYYLLIGVYTDEFEPIVINFSIVKETDDMYEAYENALLIQSDTIYEEFIDILEKVYYRFIPDTSGTYVFKTMGEFDTYGRLFDQQLILIDANDDGPIDYNFEITAVLQGGDVYYIVFEMFFDDTDSGQVQFIVEKIA